MASKANNKLSQLATEINQFAERRIQDRLPVDPLLIICTVCLILVGLVMMTSASISYADKTHGEAFYYFERQFYFMMAGLFAAACVYKIPLQFWNRIRPLLLILCLLLLAVILIPGVGQTVNGSTRWIRLGSINIQISEIVKVCFVIFLAGYLAKKVEDLKLSVKPAYMPILLFVLIAALLLAEPDFGATVVLFATAMSMLLLSGVRLKLFAFLTLVAGSSFFLLAINSTYRLKRLTVFLNPWADPYDQGFQLSQSLIAFGRGEWFGVGLGESVQKLFYLPEAHTDFVFAIIAEELGVVGALVIIILYASIAWRSLKIGKESQNQQKYFAAFLSYGIGCGMIFQAYVNIGVNMGVLPTKGLTLPFISYGGSSMMMSCVAIALILRADYELRYQYREKNRERRAKC